VYRQDDDTLLAALQLAQEKWGGVKLNGTDEYKRRCVEIAAKNGVRIANPELQGIASALTGTGLSAKEPDRAEPKRDIFVLARELARQHLSDGVIFAISPMDGREYQGKLLGVVESGGRRVAVQAVSSSQVIAHYVDKSDLPALERLKGRNAIMTSENYHLRTVEDTGIAESRERNRKRGWSR
jgi:hypothetical protein